MITYNGDILAKLKEAGYSTYRMRKEKIMGESTLQRLREGKSVSFEQLNRICTMLNCELHEVLIHTKDEELVTEEVSE